MTELMSWADHDWTQPQPWATVPCPVCEERELAKAFSADTTMFVCMNCGELTKIEDRSGGTP
jgi:hypothetical protein